MTPSRALLVTIGAVALGVVSAWASYGPGPLSGATGWLVAGWTCIACGLAAGLIAPWSAIGASLVLAGALWLLPDGSTCLNVEPLSHRCVALGLPTATVGAIGWLWVAPVSHAIVRFPGGHASRWSVTLALSAWALIAGFAIASGAAWPVNSVGGLLLVAVVAVSMALLGGLRVVEVGRGPRTTDDALGLGTSLARAVGDPTLAVAIRAPDGDGWLDLSGNAIDAPDGEVTVTPITRDGVEVARVTHDPSALADEGVRTAVFRAVELEAHNVRLRASLEAQARSLEESRHRLVDAGLQERRALATQVDAEVLHRLDGIARRLDTLTSHGAAPTAALTRAQASVADTRSDVATLAAGVYPTELEIKGLVASVRDLAKSASLEVTVQASDRRRSDALIEATLYFVCAESLANVQRHAMANHVRITIDDTPTEVRAEIVDDGRGGADLDAGTGLRGLRDRVEALGGTLVIDSDPGMGTRLEAIIPIAPEAR